MVATWADTVRITVSDHAVWRAAERFPRFDPARIEQEVREALAAGRVTVRREDLGLSDGSDPSCLYVDASRNGRIYAIRADREDEEAVCVVTVMRAPREIE